MSNQPGPTHRGERPGGIVVAVVVRSVVLLRHWRAIPEAGDHIASTPVRFGLHPAGERHDNVLGPAPPECAANDGTSVRSPMLLAAQPDVQAGGDERTVRSQSAYDVRQVSRLRARQLWRMTCGTPWARTTEPTWNIVFANVFAFAKALQLANGVPSSRVVPRRNLNLEDFTSANSFRDELGRSLVGPFCKTTYGATRAINRYTPLQSGRRDLNPRPPEPHSGALPGCATSRPPRTRTEQQV